MPAEQPTPKSPVEFVRPEVAERLNEWTTIEATVEGEAAVKALRDKVLPRPNATDVSEQNQARYNAYLGRSVFYNVSGRTLNGLVGFVFAKEPVIKLPAVLGTLEANVDGSGVTLAQQAKKTLRLILSLGRAGLLVDYPNTPEATSKQQLIDGNISPAICLYEPSQIINWSTSYLGSRKLLDMVVLREAKIGIAEDGFALRFQPQYRVLRRTPDGVTGEIWRCEEDDGIFSPITEETYNPKDNAGNPLREIPFTFVGAENNDEQVDIPPLLDLVNLNLAHFRNSADHEEACFLVGQPTPWIAGLTQSWVNDVLKGEVHLGSRAIIPLPVGGSAGLLQAEANTMPFEAMKHKELQMVALGAKLVEQQDVQRTATEAGMDHAAEVSTLTAAAQNVFLAYKAALKFCQLFVGDDTAEIDFDLSEPLAHEIIDPNLATALVTMWQGELIDFEEARWTLKRAGIAYKDDQEVKDEFANQGLPPGPQPPPVVPPPAP